MKSKVFCIGFQKTGTTSMMAVLTGLGYRVTGPNFLYDNSIAEDLERLTAERSHQFDAFQDNPWPLVYRQMDMLHPGSKFILTTRDEDRWFQSLRSHMEGRQLSPMARLVYGDVERPSESNGHLFKDRMRAHNAGVRAYFRDRPQDLLEIDLSRDAAWEPICGFLGVPVPAQPFPHSNRRALSFLPPAARSTLKRGWHLMRGRRA